MTAPWTPGFPVTRWNVYSNSAYPLAGLVHFALAPSWHAGAFLLLQCVLGYGSYRYHKGPTPYTNRWDWTGIVGTQTFLALFAWYATEPTVALSGVILAAILVALLVWRNKRKLTHEDWHPAVLFVVAFAGAFLHGNRTLALVAAGLYALGYGCWQLEKRLGWKEGHGWWHVATAAAQSLLLAAAGGR